MQTNLPNGIYDWPGNIRELRNLIERATIFAQGGALDFDLSLTGADLTPCRLEAVDEVISDQCRNASPGAQESFYCSVEDRLTN